MLTALLTRRRDKLTLLDGAAAARCTVRVASIGRRPPVVTATRMLALDGESPVLEWPTPAPPQMLAAGAEVDLFFDYEGESLACRTRSEGPCRWTHDVGRAVDAWRFARPLRIERRQQRRAPRIAVEPLAPIDVTCEPLEFAAQRLSGRLVNVSAGGLCTQHSTEDLAGLQVGRVFRIRYRIAETGDAHAIVARVVHVRRPESSDSGVLGWRFCGGDSPELYQAQVQQIEKLVQERGQGREGKQP